MIEPIPNTLAERYCSNQMRSIWSPRGKILSERDFWIALMEAQRQLGIDIPIQDIAKYKQARPNVNLASIKERERTLKHDVKARIEEFNALAGCEQIHKGMTSRDLTENVEQLQILNSLKLVRDKAVSVLAAFSDKAIKYRDVIISARTHNVIAQPTSLGRRFTMFGEELIWAVNRIQQLIEDYPCRGLKGAVGTQQDQLTLLDGDLQKLAQLEQHLLGHLGFHAVLSNTGQVYPRSLDFDVVSMLYLISCGPTSFAKTLRLMAGHELASEGFSPGQVGSSAMPHKMNSRSAERLVGLQTLLKGSVTTASGLGGDQWNEGDVSCSVVRRVLLPDAFFAIDAILDTTLVILDQMEIYQSVIAQETLKYSPFLATTTLLMRAVQAGAPREQMHQLIKKHAIETVQALRNDATQFNNLAQRLGADSEFPLNQQQIEQVIIEVSSLVGASQQQIDHFCSTVKQLIQQHPLSQEHRAKDVEII